MLYFDLFIIIIIWTVYIEDMYCSTKYTVISVLWLFLRENLSSFLVERNSSLWLSEESF